MGKHKICVIVALAFCMAAGQPAQLTGQGGPVLRLEDAIAEALVNNDRLADQRDVTEQADLDMRLARNSFRPKITPNVFGSFGQTNVNTQTYRVDVSRQFTTGTEVRLGVGTATAQIPGPTGGPDIRFYNADTTLTLSQPLLRGFGRNVTRRSLSSAELRRTDADRLQTLAEQQITVEVAAAYYQVVAQEAFVGVAKQSVERARRLRDASEAKLEIGLVSQLDVLRAQQLVSQAEIQLFDAQSQVEDAHDQLSFLLGRDSSRAFEVEASIPKQNDAMDEDAAIAIALENRVDLKGRAAQNADADRQVLYARNQLLPQFDVNFGLTRRETSNTFADSFRLDRFHFVTFFTISMPVDRTAQQVAYQNALIDRDRRQREVSVLERGIADEVKRAIRDRDRLLRAVVAAETSVEIGKKEVEVAQLRYERGLSNNLDVVTAESSLLLSESRRIQALANSAAARLRLRATLGVLNPRTDLVSSPDGVQNATSTLIP